MQNSEPESGRAAATPDQNLIVALRVRPISCDELDAGASPIATAVDDKMVVLMDPIDDPDDILRHNRSRQKSYIFDQVFGGNSTQEEVYANTSKLLIPGVTEGYNATVFAYGATGAGKTHTMLGDEAEPGVMARSLNALFQHMADTSQDMAYGVTMSYLEIYNEMIRDLLDPSNGFLELREDSKGEVQVAGLSETSATSTNEVMDMLQRGNTQRTQEPTAANKTSSRSHAVLQVIVRQRNRVRNVLQEVRTGKLFLVDLAGSERAANTRNRGKRMVEGAHINRSLLALGNCINALSDGHKYVNFRDSKLTRLLKDALGGNCKTVMIAHVSPASTNFEESRNTLVYADRAKQIRTKVKRNVLDVSYHVAQYTSIIAELRAEINRLKTRAQNDSKGDQPKSSDGRQLRDRLVLAFNEQMDIRRSLVEVNNSAMEIKFDLSRNCGLMKRYAMASWSEISEISSPRSTETSVQLREARREEVALRRELERTERLRENLEIELVTAKEQVSEMEKELNSSAAGTVERKILSLLCRVHQLEVDKLESQSNGLLGNIEIRKREMALEAQRREADIASRLIREQKELLEERQIDYPTQLLQLEKLYHRQKLEPIDLGTPRSDQRDEPRSTDSSQAKPKHAANFLGKLQRNSSTVDPVVGQRLGKVNDVVIDDDEKLFSKSRKLGGQIRQSKLGQVRPVANLQRKSSILTLSATDSSSTSPLPDASPPLTGFSANAYPIRHQAMIPYEIPGKARVTGASSVNRLARRPSRRAHLQPRNNRAPQHRPARVPPVRDRAAARPENGRQTRVGKIRSFPLNSTYTKRVNQPPDFSIAGTSFR